MLGSSPVIVAFHWYSDVEPTVIAVFEAGIVCAVQLSTPERPYFTDPAVNAVVVAQFTLTLSRTRSVRYG